MAAGLVAAAVIGTVAVALIDNSGHGKQPAGHLADSMPPTASLGRSAIRGLAGDLAYKFGDPYGHHGDGDDHRLRHDRAAGHAYRGEPCDDTCRSPVRDNRSDRTAPGIHSDTDHQGHPGNAFRLPVGRTLWVPPGGTTISLTAQGGPVTWSSTVSSGSGTVQLSPSGGTINAGATATVTVTASGGATAGR